MRGESRRPAQAHGIGRSEEHQTGRGAGLQGTVFRRQPARPRTSVSRATAVCRATGQQTWFHHRQYLLQAPLHCGRETCPCCI